MSRSASEHILKNFSMDSISKKYVKLYTDLIENNQSFVASTLKLSSCKKFFGSRLSFSRSFNSRLLLSLILKNSILVNPTALRVFSIVFFIIYKLMTPALEVIIY